MFFWDRGNTVCAERICGLMIANLARRFSALRGFMRLFTRVIVVAISVVVSLQAMSHAQFAPSTEVLRLAPALDQLVAPGVEPEVVSGGYVFTEGPVWRGGGLYATAVD